MLRIAKKAMNDVKQFEMQEYTETAKGSKWQHIVLQYAELH